MLLYEYMNIYNREKVFKISLHESILPLPSLQKNLNCQNWGLFYMLKIASQQYTSDNEIFFF